MSDPATTPAGLDHRLARLIGTLDAEPGFEARLAARLARERPVPDATARARARERLLRERGSAELALRRTLRTNLLLLAGAALAATGPAWLCARLLANALGALPSGDVPALALASGAAFVAWVGAVLARTARGQAATGLLA